MTPQQGKTLIQNVNVFDGHQMQSSQAVAFENGLIISDTDGADTVIDANGLFLVPGLIDSHVHVHDAEDLYLMARAGVTTGLDMGTKDLRIFEKLRGGVGHCDIRSAGFPAMPPGSRHTSKPGFPPQLLVSRPEQAKQFVADRISGGADFVKVMIEPEGPEQAVIDALAAAVREQGRKSIAHATTCDAIKKAAEAKVDVVTHVPLEDRLSSEVASKMKSTGAVAVPTLVKMLATASTDSKLDYANAKASTKTIRDARVQIIAGTDANKHSSGAGRVSYGESMWKELELLVETGLSPVEALQSATTLPAEYFDLGDRGLIQIGKRADMVLLSKNPLEDILNISSVSKVWCFGVPVETSTD